MAVSLVELILVVAVVYLIARNLLLWHASGRRQIDQRAVAADSEQRLKYAVDSAKSVFTGKRGRGLQIFAIIVLVIAANTLGMSKVAWLVILALATMILMSILRHQSNPQSPTSDSKSNDEPSPSDKPVHFMVNVHAPRRVPTPEEYILERENFRSRRNRWAMWMLPLVAITGLTFLLLIGTPSPTPSPVRTFVRDHVPQLRQTLREDAEDATASTVVDKDASPAPAKFDPNGVITVHEGLAEDPVDLVKARKFMIVSSEYSEPEQAAAAVHRTMAELLGSIVQISTPSVARSGWTPDPDWTARHFGAGQTLEKSETKGVTLYQASLMLDAPGEKEIEQLVHEFRKDEKSSRSWTILKGYVGGVCILGGLAVIARLGTSRRPARQDVSYGKRWFGRARAARA